MYRCLHIDVTFRCAFASVSYCIRWCDVATTILPLLLLLLHPFNSLYSSFATWVSRYQKDKNEYGFKWGKRRQSFGMQRLQLDYMQTMCTSLQTDNHTYTSSFNFYRLHALPDDQPTVQKHWRQVMWCKLCENCLYMLIISQLSARRLYYLSGTSKMICLKISTTALNVAQLHNMYVLRRKQMVLWNFFLSFCSTNWVWCIITTIMKITF